MIVSSINLRSAPRYKRQRGVNHLVRQEQDLTCEILLHLIEVGNRKIYRSLGFSSMFVYCTDGPGYSESSAVRKINASRAIRKCPVAFQYLRDGRINLSTLSIVWKEMRFHLGSGDPSRRDSIRACRRT